MMAMSLARVAVRYTRQLVIATRLRLQKVQVGASRFAIAPHATSHAVQKETHPV